jgi:hypothetical protein
MGASLTLEQVLANVRRGRVGYVTTTPAQRRQLRDTDGRVALDVLNHLLGARPMVPERFPLTEQAFQAVARKLGYAAGQKRCRAMIRRLRQAGVIGEAGQYRQPYRNSAARSGFGVRLFKLGRRLRGPRGSKRKRPVGNAEPVKRNSRAPWWKHGLFGDLLGLPPPEIPRPRLTRMKSLDEVFQGER